MRRRQSAFRSWAFPRGAGARSRLFRWVSLGGGGNGPFKSAARGPGQCPSVSARKRTAEARRLAAPGPCGAPGRGCPSARTPRRRRSASFVLASSARSGRAAAGAAGARTAHGYCCCPGPGRLEVERPSRAAAPPMPIGCWRVAAARR